MTVSEEQIHRARFWKKLLRLTRGRVTLLRALEVILTEETDPGFKDTLAAIRRDLEEGTDLSQALGKHGDTFSPCVRELIRTAERCGAWDEILQEIADGLSEGSFA